MPLTHLLAASLSLAITMFAAVMLVDPPTSEASVTVESPAPATTPLVLVGP